MAPISCSFCSAIASDGFDIIAAADAVIVVADRQPINRGHLLVLPLRHAPDLASLTTDEVVEMAVLAQRADQAVRTVFGATTTGTNLLMSNGVTADQGVPHAHLHLIPRQEGDGYEFREDRSRYPLPPLTDREREELQRRIGTDPSHAPRTTPHRAWSGTMLVAHGAGPVVERVVGNTAGPDSPPITLGTRFQAGSISKQLMSVVALDLVARGRLALDQPIAEHLPDIPGHLRTVTLHHLLSHTSGLGHWDSLDGVPPLLAVPPSHEELVRLTLTAEPDAAPGDRFRYSGPGFLLVALVIEAVAGRQYADVLDDVVLEPAGMHDTTSGQFPRHGAAGGHVDGRTIAVEEGFADLPGTGDLWTTASDLLRYGRALRSGQLIPHALVAEMLSPQAVLEPPDPVDRPLSATAYGYGTFLGRVLGDDGWFVPGDNPGFQSLLAEVPGADTEVVVLSNDASGVEAALHEWAETR